VDRTTRPASASGPERARGAAAGPQVPAGGTAAPGGDVVTAGGRRPGPGGGTSVRPALSGLARDPRMPIWVGRFVLAAAAGVAVGILVDWRLGLTVAVVLAILHTVYRSRATAIVPGAVRVTSAQRRTRRRLGRLTRAGYRTLHARAVPGRDGIIDHLVIGPAGVFAIDSERWDRRLPVRATQGEQLFHGPYSQTGRLRHAQLAAAQAARLIGAGLDRDLRVRPAMVIYGPRVPWTVARISGVDVFSGRRLRRYLRAQAKATRSQRLEDAEIERVYATAARALPPR
jgi:Nuclease-related domain